MLAKKMLSRVWLKARSVLSRPLSRQRLNLYVAIGSCVFAFLALYLSARIFEFQRKDSLMFELESRYQEYERLLLLAECLEQRSSEVKAIGALEGVRDHVHSTLQRGGDATRSMLLERRDEVLTVGSTAVRDVRRHLAKARSKRNIDRDCMP